MRKPRKVDMNEVVEDHIKAQLDPGFIEPTAEDILAMEEAYRAAMANDPFVKKVQETLEFLPEEQIAPQVDGPVYDITEMFEIPKDKNFDQRRARDGRVITRDGEHTWKYGEGLAIAKLEDYIRSTYKGHYAAGGREDIQAFDAILAAGHGIGFCVGDIIKYSMRLGKKDGWNRKDVMKMLHYSILLLHAMEKEGK